MGEIGRIDGFIGDPTPIPEGSLRFTAFPSPLGFVWRPTENRIEIWFVGRESTEEESTRWIGPIPLGIMIGDEFSSPDRTQEAFEAHCRRFLGLQADRIVDQLTALQDFADNHDGVFTLGFTKGEWSSTLTWGREAPESSMAGAQALGADADLGLALAHVMGEARIPLPESSAEPLTPEDAEQLFACYSGGPIDAELLDKITPKLEAIAGRELAP